MPCVVGFSLHALVHGLGAEHYGYDLGGGGGEVDTRGVVDSVFVGGKGGVEEGVVLGDLGWYVCPCLCQRDCDRGRVGRVRVGVLCVCMCVLNVEECSLLFFVKRWMGRTELYSRKNGVLII